MRSSRSTTTLPNMRTLIGVLASAALVATACSAPATSEPGADGTAGAAASGSPSSLPATAEIVRSQLLYPLSYGRTIHAQTERITRRQIVPQRSYPHDLGRH